MSCAGECVSVVSAEVHVREGRRTIRVRPVPDVVVAGKVDEGTANCTRRVCREQIELAVAKHDLVIVAKVLIEAKRSRLLVFRGSCWDIEVAPVYQGAAGRDDRLIERRDRTDPAGWDAIDVAAAQRRVARPFVVLLGEGLARVSGAVVRRGRRIVDGYAQGAEVASAHISRWSRGSGFHRGTVHVIFPGCEDEGAVLAVIQLWNRKGTADRCAILVLPQGSQCFRKVAGGVHHLVS